MKTEVEIKQAVSDLDFLIGIQTLAKPLTGATDEDLNCLAAESMALRWVLGEDVTSSFDKLRALVKDELKADPPYINAESFIKNRARSNEI